MNAPRYARLAGRLFVQERRSIPPMPPNAAARARAIAAIERAIVTRRRKRRLVECATGFVAVMAVAAIALLVRREVLNPHALAPVAAAPMTDGQIVAHPSGAGARIVLSGAQVPLSEGGNLQSGSRVITPANGGATLLFSTGTSAILGEWCDITMIGDRAAQVVRLDSGFVDLHVAKLALGQRFLVNTPDAEVEVRGTQFRVSIVPADPACGRGTWTRVAVTEGVVEVRRAGSVARVAAGEQWPTDCGRTLTVGARAIRAGATIAPTAHMPVASVGGSSAESTLGAQNNLFAQAVATKRGSDVAGAIDILDHFLTKYPTSPLTESVMVERMRLLQTASPARAVGAAKVYLARYPNGFAHAEAESMVAEAP